MTIPSKRDYKAEQASATKRGEDVDRAKRNKARRMMKAAGVKVDGLQIDHKIPLSQGGSNKLSNLRAIPAKQNQSFARTKSGAIKKRKGA